MDWDLILLAQHPVSRKEYPQEEGVHRKFYEGYIWLLGVLQLVFQ